jgi:glutathione S-transferase
LIRTLYHGWLSPFSREVRIVLGEKGLDFDLVVEKVWERRPEFLAMNPTGEVPVLVETEGQILSGAGVICEFLDESHPKDTLIGSDLLVRAETRRLRDWFGPKFYTEVTRNLVDEKLYKQFMGMGAPDSVAIRAGHENLGPNLAYISHLTERRRWLAGENFSLADIAAAAQLSCLDYMDDIPWPEVPAAKDWYARVKSRPSFRPLLEDLIPGLKPPKHYKNLDF